MNRTARIITAFAAGAAAGAILGMLFAPGKGSDTREKIKDKAKKLSSDLEEKLCRAGQKIKDLGKEMEQVVKEKTGQST